MKKKHLTILGVTVVVFVVLLAAAYIWIMNPFNIGIDPLVTSRGRLDTGMRLEISFTYEKQRMVASSQYAFWIEDMNGNYVDTLYVTKWTAQGGHELRPLSIPQWVSVANPSGMGTAELDAISGATPRSGSYFAYWDFTDRNGNPLTGTQYRYFIEGTMNNEDNVLFTGIIDIGNDSWTQTPAPQFTIPNSEYKGMLTNVTISFFPE